MSQLRIDEYRPSAVAIAGVGMGLRSAHYAHIEATRPDVPWFEVLIDNYLGKGGNGIAHLHRIRSDYPITFHGVGLSLGSTDPLNTRYLARLRQAIRDFEPAWISEHLAWNSIGGHHAHDLLPLPYTEESIIHLSTRIQAVQEHLGQRLLIENLSSYLTFRHSCIPEWEFLNSVAEESDCLILLDINNIHVSAVNHGFDGHVYLNAINPERVCEFHLAGYEDQGDFLLDTHGEPVHPPVWKLYQTAIQRYGRIPTLIEWDNNIPAFDRVLKEVRKAERIMEEEIHAVA